MFALPVNCKPKNVNYTLTNQKNCTFLQPVPRVCLYREKLSGRNTTFKLQLMKTIFTSCKTQSIFSKTIHCFKIMRIKKHVSLFSILIIISFQSKSINVQISKVDDACAEGIGSIGAFASGGTLPYTFVWSNGTTDISNDAEDTIHNLFAGVYSLTVYDAAGDSAVVSATLTNYPNLDRNGLLGAMNMMTNSGPPFPGNPGFACPNTYDGIMYGFLNIVGGIPPFSVTSFSTNNFNPYADAYIGIGTIGYYFAVDSLMTGDQFFITIADNAGCTGNFSDMEFGPDYFSTNIISTTPATNGQSNGSLTIDHHSGPFTLNIILNDSLGSVGSFNGVSGLMNLSNTLHPGTYTIYMEYNNTRNVCDTTLTVTVGNTISNAGYYWVGGTGNWSDYANHWATTSGGTTFQTAPPGPNGDVYFDANSFPTANDTVHVDVTTAYCNNFDWTGANNSPDIYGSGTTVNIYGSFILCPTMTCDLPNINFISSQTNNIIRTYGNLSLLGTNFTFNNPTGEWELADNLTLPVNGGVGNLAVVSGTFKSNNFNVTCYRITAGSATGLFGTSTIECSEFHILFGASLDLDSTIIQGVGTLTSNQNGIAFNIVNAVDIYVDSCTVNKIVCTGFNGLSNSVKEITTFYISNQATGNAIAPNHFQKAIFPFNGRIDSNTSYFDTVFVDQSSSTFQLQGNSSDTVFVNNQFIINKPSGQSNFTSNGPVLSVASGTVCLHNVALQNVAAVGGAQFYAGQGCTDAGGNTGWTFAPCSVVTDVWPGDANYDLTVNNLDVLNIGMAYGDTGAVRTGASNNYVAQPAVDWSGFFQTAVNKKHADCNGDGIVDNNDTAAIALNYGQNHPARFSNPGNQLLPSPDLYLEINPDSASLSDTVNVDVFLGTNTTPVDSIYGIAFTINFDTAYVDTTYMPFDYTGNWMGVSGVDLLTFQKTRFLEGAVDMAMVRTDHQNIGGFGFLERIGIVVVDNIGARITTPFTLSNVHAITYSEYVLAINTLNDSLSLDTISSVGINEVGNLENMISVYPNPVKEKLHIHSGRINMNGVEIYNCMGEMVVNEKINSNFVSLNVTNLQQGIYLIRCYTDKGVFNKRMVIAVRK